MVNIWLIKECHEVNHCMKCEWHKDNKQCLKTLKTLKVYTKVIYKINKPKMAYSCDAFPKD